jgi:hypothetical protein
MAFCKAQLAIPDCLPDTASVYACPRLCNLAHTMAAEAGACSELARVVVECVYSHHASEAGCTSNLCPSEGSAWDECVLKTLK